ncbi:MAG TPA: pyridoxamine 5'-phosphate oxidase family protein [Acidimicrobiia bacterium]|nr:pyridoxamine 5'-phosphate oxidase family protein [Acidimicrobiia bacterium]
MDHPQVEGLSRDECMALLETASVGRVGVSVGAIPAVLPVNYVVDGDTVVFRTVPGTKLDAALTNAVVAFEADSFDGERESGWSVLVRGVAREITDETALARVRRLPLRSWAFDGDADRFVSVDTELVTGRRVLAAAAHDG